MSGMKLQGRYGKNHKHSEKSPYSATKEALQCATTKRTLEPVVDIDCKGTTSETSEYSKNSPDREMDVARRTTDTKAGRTYFGVNVPEKCGENREESLNSLEAQCEL